MDLEFSRRERVVGTFMIVVFILLLSSFFILGKTKGWFERYVTYYTVFEESYKLQRGTAVKLYNADIGRVKEITVTGNSVRVDLDILERYSMRIRKDTIVTVESPTFIGSEFVAIRTNTDSKAEPVPPGGEILSEGKKSISAFLAEFEVEKTAKMVIDAVQDLAEMLKILKDPKGPIFTAMHTVNAILIGLEQGEGTFGSILKSRELMDEINGRMAEISRILEHVEAFAAKTPKSVDLVNQNLEQASIITGNANDFLVALNQEMNKISQILDAMETASGDVPVIMSSGRSSLSEIRNTVSEMDKIVVSMQKNFIIRGNIPKETAAEALPADSR